MELEEAIKKLQDLKDDVELGFGGWTNRLSEKEQLALETVLQALKNSIPKKTIEDKIGYLIDYYIECYGFKEEYVSKYNKDVKVLQELLEDK